MPWKLITRKSNETISNHSYFSSRINLSFTFYVFFLVLIFHFYIIVFFPYKEFYFVLNFFENNFYSYIVLVHI